jgi:hypothetical protein
MRLRIMKADRAPRVHHVAADAAVHVFLPGNGGQHLAGDGVGHVVVQHHLAGLFPARRRCLQRVGRILRVGVEQLEQHVLGVFDQARHAARAHAQQAKRRHRLVVDRKQHALAAQVARSTGSG